MRSDGIFRIDGNSVNMEFLKKTLARCAYLVASGFTGPVSKEALYPQGLTREIQVALGVAVITVNVAVYVVAIRRAKSAARRGDRPSNSA